MAQHRKGQSFGCSGSFLGAEPSEAQGAPVLGAVNPARGSGRPRAVLAVLARFARSVDLSCAPRRVDVVREGSGRSAGRSGSGLFACRGTLRCAGRWVGLVFMGRRGLANILGGACEARV